MGGHPLDMRTDHNRLHNMEALASKSIFGQLAGYEGVNDAQNRTMSVPHPVPRRTVRPHLADRAVSSGSFVLRVNAKPSSVVAAVLASTSQLLSTIAVSLCSIVR
jgi:hypothetical protein